MFRDTTAYFQGRTAILGTKHGKEQVIAPALEALGLKVEVATGLDTDQFGTFSRDRPRCGSQEEAATAKAAWVLAQTGADLAIASEGSFGPHPQFPLVPSNLELVLLIDCRHNLRLRGEALSLETNFNHATVRNLSEALAFAHKVGFPSHGLMAMVSAQPVANAPILKGITTVSELEGAIATLQPYSPDGCIHLETDMRAHMNPTRMGVIATATAELVKAMRQGCPQCGLPGFVATESIPGRPCELCGAPTSLPKAVRYRCKHCSYVLTLPTEASFADPSQCYFCNP